MILGMVYRWVWNMINFSRREHGCWEAVCTNSDAARPSYQQLSNLTDGVGCFFMVAGSLGTTGFGSLRTAKFGSLRTVLESSASSSSPSSSSPSAPYKHQYPREQMSCFLACTAESGFRVYNRGTYLTWNMYTHIYICIYVHTYKNKDALENTCFVFPDFWTFQEKHSKSM